MKEIGNFFARLSSRKFLLTIGGIIAVTLYPEGSTAICTLIATFVAGESAADTVSRYAVEKTKQVESVPHYPTATGEFDDPDDEYTGIITSGKSALPEDDQPKIQTGGEVPL